jgi:hypothetical protein
VVFLIVPVKIFRAEIGRKKEKDMLELENQINQFEKELEEGLQINNITMSAGHNPDIGGEYALYSMVHYGPNEAGNLKNKPNSTLVLV